MLCQRCGGTGREDLWLTSVLPTVPILCPECHGGRAYCCEGEQEQPEQDELPANE